MPSLVLAAGILTDILTGLPIAEGKACYYREGLMPQVVANRIRWGHIDPTLDHKGYVALADCDRIGQRVAIVADGQAWGPFLVADCGQAAHQDWLDDIGFAVDLSWEVAQAMGAGDGPIRGVRVYGWKSGIMWAMGNPMQAKNDGKCQAPTVANDAAH